jgi:hypothetical protein
MGLNYPIIILTTEMNRLMKIRHSTAFAWITASNMLLLAVIVLFASKGENHVEAEMKRTLVRELQLTDLCIFTEARYTRHPAMADNHAPFQEHPTALDHFPSGSLLLPPKRQ